MTLTLVLGGTRSGKSLRAEQLAAATGLPVRYVATADGSDPAMAGRVRAHAERRPVGWETVEAPEALAEAVRGDAGCCVLVDGLGVWIAGLMHRRGALDDSDDAVLRRVRAEVSDGVAVLLTGGQRGEMIVVAEEAGQGVVPPDRGSRAWLDLLGDAVQRLAAAAARVELVVAGRALELFADVARPDVAALRRHGDRDVTPGLADHAVNVLAGGPPPWLLEELHRALDAKASVYPRDDEARERLAALHGRTAEEIVPTNGAAEALWLLPAALRPRLAACVHPGFTEAEAALRAHGIPCVRVLREPERDFVLDPTGVPAAADLVIVGNPASPTGTLDPAAAVLALRRPGRTVVVDEAFMDLVPGEPGSLVRERLEDVIVIRSLTKSLAIPGLRAGYAVAPRGLVARLEAVRPPWSANALALAALVAVAGRPEVMAAGAERAQAERRDLEERLRTIPGVRTWPAAANFCLVEVEDGPAVTTALRRHGIAVRPAASFPGLAAGHLRITARGPDENSRLVAALAEAVLGGQAGVGAQRVDVRRTTERAP